ncbi:unnamed protein product [Staurois parvus]|uniref:Reverse transcriptase domain-containing protein n=1 Tax=Staurois parvus TaxID=386267 RepID=A0ABN9AY97_9NEOB|nr:unnamed protein product [Staurois parvus]
MVVGSTCWRWIRLRLLTGLITSTSGISLAGMAWRERFIGWLQTLYKGAESFMLVNGWVGRPLGVGSGVRQGCPLSPLLYAFAINPFVRRLDGGVLGGVSGGTTGESPLRLVAYADDVSVFISGTSEAQEVVSVMEQYAEASGSKINHDKCEVFWMGREGEGFELLDAFPEPRQKIKVLGIEFGPDDYSKTNWEYRLSDADVKVRCWKGWRLSLRERVNLIKTYLVPIFL